MPQRRCVPEATLRIRKRGIDIKLVAKSQSQPVLDVRNLDLERVVHAAEILGVASVAFHLRHIAGSLDRRLTYAEGPVLSGAQMDVLHNEMDEGASAEVVLAELRAGLGEAGSG